MAVRKKSGKIRIKKKNAKPTSKFSYLLTEEESSDSGGKTSVSSQQYRAICFLIDGFTIVETAKELNIPPKTIHHWLYSDKPVGIKFQNAYKDETKRRIEALRIQSDSIAFDMYDILIDWIQFMKKRRGKLSPKEVSVVVSYLNNSHYLMKDETKAKEEKAREKILAGLEQFIEEKVLETQVRDE